MTPYIIIAIAFLLGIISFCRYALKKGSKIEREQQEKLKRSKTAKAKIFHHSYGGIRGTGNYGQYQTQKITLEVYNENMQPYKATTYWEVPDIFIPKIQQGLEVKVKIDADDPSIIYPNIEGIEFCFICAKRK